MVDDTSRANWQFLTAMITVGIAMVAGVLWIGQLTNQIGVNTGRLDRLEQYANESRDHRANIDATFRDVDRRLNHLEQRVLTASPR